MEDLTPVNIGKGLVIEAPGIAQAVRLGQAIDVRGLARTVDAFKRDEQART